MKVKILVPLIGIISFFSCNNDDGSKFDLNTFPQKWTLIAMSVGMSTNLVEGDHMQWQEILVLMENGTFTKTGDIDGDIIVASGTFEVSVNAGDRFLMLEFEEGSTIQEICPGETQETYSFLSSEMLSGGAISCDGSALIYERVN